MSDEQTVFGMGGSGWRTTGVVTSGLGTLLAMQGSNAAARAAMSSGRNRAWAIRRNAKGEALDKFTAANRMLGQRDVVLASYLSERSLRADKADRETAAVLSSYAKNGISLDSDSVRAVQEDRVSANAELEALHKLDSTYKAVQFDQSARDMRLSAEAGVASADLEAGFAVLDARSRRDAYRNEALGQAVTGVASISSMFAR